jgi:hypothetical protein
MAPGTRELGLFTASDARARRGQPRDARGRFIRVEYSAHRLKVLEVARAMRVRLGLPPSPWLEPWQTKDEEGGQRGKQQDRVD